MSQSDASTLQNNRWIEIKFMEDGFMCYLILCSVAIIMTGIVVRNDLMKTKIFMSYPNSQVGLVSKPSQEA